MKFGQKLKERDIFFKQTLKQTLGLKAPFPHLP